MISGMRGVELLKFGEPSDCIKKRNLVGRIPWREGRPCHETAPILESMLHEMQASGSTREEKARTTGSASARAESRCGTTRHDGKGRR